MSIDGKGSSTSHRENRRSELEQAMQVRRLGHAVVQVKQESGDGDEGDGRNGRPDQPHLAVHEEIDEDLDPQAFDGDADKRVGEDIEPLARGFRCHQRDRRRDQLGEYRQRHGDLPCPAGIASEDPQGEEEERRGEEGDKEAPGAVLVHDEEGGSHDRDEEEGGNRVEGPGEPCRHEEVDEEESDRRYGKGDRDHLPGDLALVARGQGFYIIGRSKERGQARGSGWRVLAGDALLSGAVRRGAGILAAAEGTGGGVADFDAAVGTIWHWSFLQIAFDLDGEAELSKSGEKQALGFTRYHETSEIHAEHAAPTQA